MARVRTKGPVCVCGACVLLTFRRPPQLVHNLHIRSRQHQIPHSRHVRHTSRDAQMQRREPTITPQVQTAYTMPILVRTSVIRDQDLRAQRVPVPTSVMQRRKTILHRLELAQCHNNATTTLTKHIIKTRTLSLEHGFAPPRNAAFSCISSPMIAYFLS